MESKKHHNRPDLTGEHPYGDAGQLILLITFVVTIVLNSFILDYYDPLRNAIPLLIRIILGASLLIISLYLSAVSLQIVFGERHENSVVFQRKVYSRVRHPMYLGSILCFLAFAIVFPSLPATIMFTVIVLFYNHIAKYEEKLLINKFGKRYRLYMERVPRWIPRIFPLKLSKE